MNQHHHPDTPPVRRRPRARVTPLALLRARAHRRAAHTPPRQRPQCEEDH
jgi:hypothetical protein